MRRTLSLCDGWLFHLGDIGLEDAQSKRVVYLEAKCERKRSGPAAYGYPDQSEEYSDSGLLTRETWQQIMLPHDYIIGQAPDGEYNNALGCFRYKNAWYRKHFTLDAADACKRVRVYFEGAAVHTTVYANGCYMMTNRCGYNSFEADLSDVVSFGKDNVLAVYIDATGEHEGWWYEGAGIYRPVWLEICDEVSVDRYGVYVHPERLAPGMWDVPVDTTIRNDGFEPAMVTVETCLISPDGTETAACAGEFAVPMREKATLRQTMGMKNPELWSVDTPCLYTAVTRVLVKGECVDEQHNRFGFRTIRFDAEKGFFLNDRHVVIQGVCCHQDYGLTGKAVPERVQRYRLELLREMGANGYRTSHYPQHAYTMDCMDELGFLVMDETRWYESTPEGLAQLEMLVKRDRNHPCVIMWSIGNEEPFHARDTGRRIARAMMAVLRRWDDTRPITTAVSHAPEKASVMELVDLIGINYNLQDFDKLHEKFQGKPILSSENCATGTTRGWYRADAPEWGYINAFDRNTNSQFLSREGTWRFFRARPWVAGGFQWAGIEHRGETVWPRLCSQSGALDLFLQRKDAFYQNQSLWTVNPMVHLLPHWNWPGHEGMPVRVWAYTNCDRVELLLNGEPMGAREVDPFSHAEWEVPYKPGLLEAKGFVKGALVCEDKVETTGAPACLRLRLESGGVRADGRDVAIVTCDCLDAQGRPVPTASPLVSFAANELGTIAGTGSSVADHVPITCPQRRMYAGLISVLVRVKNSKGTLRVTAEAQGLRPALLSIELS